MALLLTMNSVTQSRTFPHNTKGTQALKRGLRTLTFVLTTSYMRLGYCFGKWHGSLPSLAANTPSNQ
jgi:hypothetical protein